MNNKAADLPGRFREIISDPLNIAIKRDPLAGMVTGNNVFLHNGLQVAKQGALAYCGSFSDVLVFNRGVHEPLEEFVFQQVINQLPSAPIMLELGSYWAHYSMWLKKTHADASVYMVEPNDSNMVCGKHNFNINNLSGTWISEFVGHNAFSVDRFFAEFTDVKKLDILHSDIQGYEVEMLDGAKSSLDAQLIDYVFVSTHSQEIHLKVVEQLKLQQYVVEISSDYDFETTSFDGFVFASSPRIPRMFNNFIPMGRTEIVKASPEQIASYLKTVI
jgi:hypothetical protein